MKVKLRAEGNDMKAVRRSDQAGPVDVRLEHLTKRHSLVLPPAVDDLSLEIQAGEFLTLLGPSGSGKTTILNMLAGFSVPTSGSIRLGSADITHIPVHRRNIGMVFQNYALFPHMTAAENVSFPLRRRGYSKSDAMAAAHKALATVDLAKFGDRRPSQLSGGQQQRVAVARAIVYQPQLILMDEPFGALDKNLRQDLQLEMLRLHHELGVTFVFVTHDQEEALSMSDRIAVLAAGRLQQVGTPRALYESPESQFVAEFLGESNRFSGRKSTSNSFHTSLGPVSFDGASAVTGDEVSVIVRPERVALLPTDAPSDAEHNSLPCRITELIYLGGVRKVVVAFEDGTRGIAREPTNSIVRFSNGARAKFTWHVSDGVVLPANRSS